MTEQQLSEQSGTRRWIEVEQRLYWRVDVTDWLEPGDESKTDGELWQMARDKLDYHECQNGDEVECIGYDWGRRS